MRIFVGLLIVIFGALVAAKANWLVQNFGYSEFGESKLRQLGGTRLIWKFVGIISILTGFLVIANLHGDIILWVFRSFFSGLSQTQ